MAFSTGIITAPGAKHRHIGNPWQKAALWLAFLPATAAPIHGPDAPRQYISITWNQVLEKISQKLPMKKNDIENLFNNDLHEEDKHSTFLSKYAREVETNDGALLENVYYESVRNIAYRFEFDVDVGKEARCVDLENALQTLHISKRSKRQFYVPDAFYMSAYRRTYKRGYREIAVEFRHEQCVSSFVQQLNGGNRRLAVK